MLPVDNNKRLLYTNIVKYNTIQFELVMKDGRKILYRKTFLNALGATVREIGVMLKQYADYQSYRRMN